LNNYNFFINYLSLRLKFSRKNILQNGWGKTHKQLFFQILR